REKWHCIIGGVAGLVIGILVNPYFPGNLALIPQVMGIVIGTQSTGSLNYGAELYPQKTNDFLRLSLLVCFSILAGSYFQGAASDPRFREDRDDASDTKMFLYLAIVFFIVSMLTPRGRKYLLPSTAFLLTLCLKQRGDSLKFVVPLLVVAVGQFFA